tara:strand:+ start:325 stop:1173 length:849 start_codon:yes stop_codon:yes gene_type:complete
MVLVPKSMANGLCLDEVEAFFSIVPVEDPDNENYDFKKQVEKVLKKYARDNDDWHSDQSICNGKVILRQMINNDELRWNKKRTGFKPTWKKFDLWRNQLIIKWASDMDDSEKEAMAQEISCDLLQNDAKKLQEMTKKYKAEKKTNKDLREENAKLKEALSRRDGEFNMGNNSIEDYANSDEPMKLYERTVDAADQLVIEIFISKGSNMEEASDLCDKYGEWVDEEQDICGRWCDSTLSAEIRKREHPPRWKRYWPEGFRAVIGNGLEEDRLLAKLEEIKIDS